MKVIVPSYQKSLAEDEQLYKEIKDKINKVLKV